MTDMTEAEYQESKRLELRHATDELGRLRGARDAEMDEFRRGEADRRVAEQERLVAEIRDCLH